MFRHEFAGGLIVIDWEGTIERREEPYQVCDDKFHTKTLLLHVQKKARKQGKVRPGKKKAGRSKARKVARRESARRLGVRAAECPMKLLRFRGSLVASP